MGDSSEAIVYCVVAISNDELHRKRLTEYPQPTLIANNLKEQHFELIQSLMDNDYDELKTTVDGATLISGKSYIICEVKTVKTPDSAEALTILSFYDAEGNKQKMDTPIPIQNKPTRQVPSSTKVSTTQKPLTAFKPTPSKKKPIMMTAIPIAEENKSALFDFIIDFAAKTKLTEPKLRVNLMRGDRDYLAQFNLLETRATVGAKHQDPTKETLEADDLNKLGLPFDSIEFTTSDGGPFLAVISYKKSENGQGGQFSIDSIDKSIDGESKKLVEEFCDNLNKALTQNDIKLTKPDEKLPESKQNGNKEPVVRSRGNLNKAPIPNNTRTTTMKEQLSESKRGKPKENFFLENARALKNAFKEFINKLTALKNKNAEADKNKGPKPKL